MKKHILFWSLSFIIFSVIISCHKNNNNVVPQNVQNIQVIPGYGNVVFTWSFPNDSDYLYVSVSYLDSGKKIEQKFSKFTDTATISGLVNKPYTFSVSAISIAGVSSTPQTFTVSPNNPVYTIVSSTLSITPGFGLVTIKWNNVTGLTAGIKVVYADSSGTSQIASASSANPTDSIIISGLANVSTTFVVTFSDASGVTGNPVTLTATPLLEIKFSKANWTITADSQQDNGEEPAPSGFATAAIDNDINTYWHTEYDPDLPGFPHWIAINMQQQATVSRVEVTPRQDNTTAQITNFNIDGSNDGINWTTYNSFVLKSGINTQSFTITALPKIQYIRLYATAGPQPYTNLGEFSVFGNE